MEMLNFDQFIYDIPWSDNVRHKLRVMADRDDLRYLVAVTVRSKPSCSAFIAKPDSWPDGAFAIWSKRGDDPRLPVVTSKTMQAVALVLDDGLTAYAAAKRMGINQSAVHRALKRRIGKDVCHACGQVIRVCA